MSVQFHTSVSPPGPVLDRVKETVAMPRPASVGFGVPVSGL